MALTCIKIVAWTNIYFTQHNVLNSCKNNSTNNNLAHAQTTMFEEVNTESGVTAKHVLPALKPII